MKKYHFDDCDIAIDHRKEELYIIVSDKFEKEIDQFLPVY
jgi:hypothetical protein